jgi:hypothetical protein
MCCTPARCTTSLLKFVSRFQAYIVHVVMLPSQSQRVAVLRSLSVTPHLAAHVASVLLGHAPAKAEAGGGLTWQLNQILLHQRMFPFGSSVIEIRPNSAVFLASLTHSARSC